MRLLVTREDYFAAAMKLLATKGAGKLKIAPLCKALGVTTGSFYGYFGSFDGFVTDFLKYWEDTQTERIVQLSNVPPDPADRVRQLKKLGARLPHEAEAAIRSWAHTNPAVEEVQKRVDERRQQALTEVFAPIVGSKREASKLAVIGMTMLVGLQQWRSPVTTRDYNLLFDELERMVLRRVTDRAVS
ncbi:TetR/AcrR family transcriptional regulator [Hoyosella subflava]|uniref:Putative TetR family transcriptional regulator n=1 Tax=Hoyosella subflava (strain DSM 45089 / JCM 17490 / NBRC 109087 / DQS3-9A1) TaxID=443218 RepID=F6ER18_HOYSD|nr:TetR/AcrR family transcriptional regulator [Hoyosella subflava]AEF40705.1 Putative TetR family transcriptional regulator [Hoyosella subflava DQS3-9A1]